MNSSDYSAGYRAGVEACIRHLQATSQDFAQMGTQCRVAYDEIKVLPDWHKPPDKGSSYMRDMVKFNGNSVLLTGQANALRELLQPTESANNAVQQTRPNVGSVPDVQHGPMPGRRVRNAGRT